MTRGVKNIGPLSKRSFRNFLHKRKVVLIALIVMGFGVFLIGQTVSPNFFKKIFSPQKTSVAKDSAASKQKTPRIRVVKKPVVDDAEKTLVPGITCPPLNQVICLVNTTSYTHSGTSWDATGTNDPLCPPTPGPTVTYASTGPVNPTTGTTLHNAVFSAGVINITWTITDPCNNTASCASFTVTVYPDLDPGAHNTDPVTSCVGYNPAQLNINTPAPSGGSPPYTYQWQINGVNTGAPSSPIYNPTAIGSPGDYDYNCVITDQCGTIVSTPVKTITIVNDPVVTASGGGTFCQNSNPTLTGNITGGTGVMNFQWQTGTSSTGPWADIPGATSSDYLPPTSPGVYYYRVELSPNVASCNNSSSTITLTVNPTPTATAPANQTYCNNVPTTAIPLTGTPAGVVFDITGGAAIGLANQIGVTSIPSFTPTTGGPTTITITPRANGCTGTAVTYNITVNPTPTVNQPANQVVCNNTSTAAINFSGTGATSYTWTNSNTSIGLAASGTGNIAAFTATNTGSTTATATIIVTPVFTGGSVSCNGPTQTFTITVNPTPTVNQPANQVVCNNTSTTAVNFSGTGATSYTWTNSNTSIGLAASGTGNIAAFTATNTGSTAAIATIIVTPVFTGGSVSCNGPTQTFSITVNPTPTVNQPANQVVCNNTSTTAVNFSGTGATSYTWTNSNTSIGLAASGSGNIAVFTATNATAAPVTATIIVTPVFTGGSVSCNGSTQTFSITVNPTIVPSVTIAASPGNNICAGTSVTFTATPVNGGTPSYQWYVSGSPVGTNSPTFTSSSLVNTNAVSVVMTPSVTCPSPATATSNVITMTVNALVTPSVTVAPSATTICPGTSVTFNATAFNGGSSPSYQWQVNGVNAGTNNSSFNTTSLANGDVVTVILTSNATCASPTTATSAPVTMTVNPPPPAIPGTITGTSPVCPGITGLTYNIAAVPNATSYNWAVPAGWTVTGGAGTTSITVTSGSAGQNGNITVTATNSCGTSLASSLPVVVSPGTPATPGLISRDITSLSGYNRINL